MKAKVEISHDGFILRISEADAAQANLVAGTAAEIKIRTPRTPIDERIARIRPETLHESWDWEPPVGREF